jgi:hypothetical protein
MSGGITQLVAIGAQDAHLVGNPEVSMFQSVYKRHTNFAQLCDRQIIQGAQSAGGMSTVRLERKGDLISHIYFTAVEGATSNTLSSAEWINAIDKVELLIGGQVIDEQTSVFSERLAVDLLAQNLSKSAMGSHHVGGGGGAGSESYFYPLRFSFFENSPSSIPMVALQYHDVELRITWGTSIAPNTIECFANFIYLDTDEREMIASRPRDMLITQVQRAPGSGAKTLDLNFNHPVKFIAMSNVTASSGFFETTNKAKLQVNGTDLADYKFVIPHFTQAASYYSAPFSVGNTDDYMLYSWCMDTSKLQPSGSLNFSRIDNARLISQAGNIDDDVYAVNYNVLHIENGLGGLLYAN